MELSEALTFASQGHQAVLTTIRNNSRPQLSSVLHAVGDDGIIRISITASRAKYTNMRRRPWAALHVGSPDFWSYVVIEADVTLSGVAQAPDDETVDELADLYRSVMGDHPDWEEFRRAMVADQRVVARLHPSRAYGSIR